jgi:hypothetical protein
MAFVLISMKDAQEISSSAYLSFTSTRLRRAADYFVNSYYLNLGNARLN